MHASGRVLLFLLALAWVTPAGAAECRAGNEMLEAYGRGSLTFGRTYGIWLHFAGLDGDVSKAGQEGG